MSDEEPRRRSFWATMPGVLTGVAALISAVVALIVAFHQLGGSTTPPGPIPILSVASPSGEASATSTGPSVRPSPSPDGGSPSTAPQPGLDAIQPQDCLPYDPTHLSVVDEGSSGWLLTDGVSRMKELDNATDAQNALALARMHTAHCFIGRDNTRANRSEYIVEYWTGDSGISATIDPEDCIGYDQPHLSVTDEGASGWVLTDGSSRMLVLDNQRDAQNALILARAFTNQCFIGRDNSRADRLGYILQYWT